MRTWLAVAELERLRDAQVSARIDYERERASLQVREVRLERLLRRDADSNLSRDILSIAGDVLEVHGSCASHDFADAEDVCTRAILEIARGGGVLREKRIILTRFAGGDRPVGIEFPYDAGPKMGAALFAVGLRPHFRGDVAPLLNDDERDAGIELLLAIRKGWECGASLPVFAGPIAEVTTA